MKPKKNEFEVESMHILYTLLLCLESELMERLDREIALWVSSL